MLWRPSGSGRFEALKEVSFEIAPGESLGLIGANGAGKSTLLNLATGLTLPDAGRIEVNGRVAALLELGAGFHPDLTGGGEPPHQRRDDGPHAPPDSGSL